MNIGQNSGFRFAAHRDTLCASIVTPDDDLGRCFQLLCELGESTRVLQRAGRQKLPDKSSSRD